VFSEKGLTQSNLTLRYCDSLYILKCGITDSHKSLLLEHDIAKQELRVKD
jgi:hypothetical protein